MKKTKQILAWIGIIALVSMYLMALILSFFKSEGAGVMFRAAIGCTIIIPVFLYLILMVARVLRPAKSPLIDAIVFDIGKVLVDYPWEERTENMECDPELKEFFKTTIDPSPLWKELDLGIRSEADITEEFVRMNPKFADEIREYMRSTPEIISKFWFTDDLIASLHRKGYRTYFLSNWCAEHYDFLKDKGTLNFTKKMNGGIWSFEVHERKPGKKIFQMLIDKYRLVPDRCVFIDDTDANIDTARKLGFAAIRFDGYNDLVEKLNSVGVYF